MKTLEASAKADLSEIEDQLQLVSIRLDSLDIADNTNVTHKPNSEFVHESNVARPSESPGKNWAAFGAASAPSFGSPRTGQSHDECNRHKFVPSPFEAHVRAEHVPSWDLPAAAPHDYRGPSPSPPPPPLRPQPQPQQQPGPHAAPGYGQLRPVNDGLGQHGSSQPTPGTQDSFSSIDVPLGPFDRDQWVLKLKAPENMKPYNGDTHHFKRWWNRLRGHCSLSFIGWRPVLDGVVLQEDLHWASLRTACYASPQFCKDVNMDLGQLKAFHHTVVVPWVLLAW